MKIEALAETLKSKPTSWEFKMERLFTFRNFPFHFQMIIDNKYIADFLFPDIKLIIELDGCYHDLKNKKKTDRIRDEYLRSKGFTVIRFKNSMVDSDPELILDLIERRLNNGRRPN